MPPEKWPIKIGLGGRIPPDWVAELNRMPGRIPSDFASKPYEEISAENTITIRLATGKICTACYFIMRDQVDYNVKLMFG